MLMSGTISITPSANRVAIRNSRLRVMTVPCAWPPTRGNCPPTTPSREIPATRCFSTDGQVHWPKSASINRRAPCVEFLWSFPDGGAGRRSDGGQCQGGAHALVRVGDGEAAAVQLRHLLYEVQPQSGALPATARARQGIETLRNTRQREVGNRFPIIFHRDGDHRRRARLCGGRCADPDPVTRRREIGSIVQQ